MDEDQKNRISEIRLLNEQNVLLKQLTGFQKNFRVSHPPTVSDWNFVTRIAAADIETDMQQVYSKLRSAYGLKRKQIANTGPTDGIGIISTPWFDYEIMICQSVDQPGQAIWQRSIANIGDPDQAFTSTFETVFGKLFSMLEVSASQPFDIEAVIDHLEDSAETDLALKYDKNATWCEIPATGSAATVRVENNTIRIVSNQPISVSQLMETFLEVRQRFKDFL